MKAWNGRILFFSLLCRSRLFSLHFRWGWWLRNISNFACPSKSHAQASQSFWVIYCAVQLNTTLEHFTNLQRLMTSSIPICSTQFWLSSLTTFTRILRNQTFKTRQNSGRGISICFRLLSILSNAFLPPRSYSPPPPIGRGKSDYNFIEMPFSASLHRHSVCFKALAQPS